MGEKPEPTGRSGQRYVAWGVVLVAVYVLSILPAVWLTEKDYIPQSAESLLRFVYMPLLLLSILLGLGEELVDFLNWFAKSI